MEKMSIKGESENEEVSPTKYTWVNKERHEHMVTLTPDIDEMSLYSAAEQILKSHVYSALGCALYEGKNIIVWIDYPLAVLKMMCQKRESKRIYYTGSIKTRGYNLLEWEDDFFGLSMAIQELKFPEDTFMREYGLAVQSGKFSFMENDWDEPVKYLLLDIEAVNKEPTQRKMKKWLEMETDEEEKEETEKIRKDLRKRKEEMNKRK
jgi:hypothetical protein